jgi:acyl carrier protein
MRNRIIEIFRDELALPPSEITVDLRYNGVPEWDSVAHMALISALEHEFGVSFQDEEIVEMTTIKAIEQIVVKRVAA